jgi:hypothetical protein
MAAVIIPMDGVPAVQHLLTICNLSAGQMTAVMDTEGIQDIALLSNIHIGDIAKMTENLSRLPINRGGAYIGTGATSNLKALIWWVQDHLAQGLTIDPNDWSAGMLDNARQRMLLQKAERDRKDDVIDAPKKLDPSKWTDAYLAFLNFLRTQKSADGKRSLDYVVRKDLSAGWALTSREERLKYNAPLNGPFYLEDNQKVYRVTKQWTLHTCIFVGTSFRQCRRWPWRYSSHA